MIGAILGVGAAILIGLSDLFGRRVTLRSSAITSSSTMQAFGAISVLLSLVFWPGTFSGRDALLGALSGAGFATGLCCYYLGLTRNSSAVVAPVAAVLSALIPFGWAITRGVQVSSVALLGAALALLGLGVVTTTKTPQVPITTGVQLGLLAGLGYGVGQAVLLDIAATAGPIAIASQRVIAFGLMIPLALVTNNRVMAPPGSKRWGLLAGICVSAASIAFFQGLRFDPVATVIGISLFPVFSVVVGRIQYQDALTRKQAVGIACAVVGIIGVVAG
ncbi:MAG TPA: hypothetical protein DCX77_08825 [Acidimicrobiaceae bacterium]|nr:hypothetical protein [Acidimicrobiaceae bacterium]HAX05766.1 hypothetical protein [Acidimicrobiaceae bacterium]